MFLNTKKSILFLLFELSIKLLVIPNFLKSNNRHYVIKKPSKILIHFFLIIFVNKNRNQMKQLFILIGFISLIGCRKDKNCTCEHKVDGHVKATSEQITDKECIDLNNSSTIDDTTYALECKEK